MSVAAGGQDASGVNLADSLDPNTTLVPGSIVVSPVAVDEAYASVGNMTLTSAAIGTDCASPAHSVLCNDIIRSATLSGFGATQPTANGTVPNGSNSVTTGGGGTVVLGTDGTFVYNPAAGFEGADSFWYTLTNAAGSDAGQVTINVGGVNGMVWFVSPAGGGSGRQANPISLSALNTVNNGTGTNPAANDTIFVFEGAHSGSITLLSGQRLLGQDATASVQALGGPAAKPGNIYPPINPTGTTVSITSAATTITLGSSNALAGFTVGGSTIAIAATAAGSFSAREVVINSTGAGLSITTSGTAVTDAVFGGFTSVTSTGGATGISLTGVNGTLNLGSGALSGATGNEFNVSGGAGDLSYSGTIASGTARSVNVSGKTGGSVTFSGAVTDTDTGISLTGNTGATITFAGGINASTGASAAFTATGGGTVVATQNNTSIVNTLTTTTATALNVANTTIGAGGLTFRSISSNGAASGIILNTTGSTGGLTVTGNGGTCTSAGTCTGGTIQASSGAGVSLTSTSGVSFDRMNIDTSADSGVNGTGVTNFTFTNGRIINAGNANFDSAIGFNGVTTGLGTNLIGTLTVTGNNFQNPFYSGLDVQSDNGTVSNATITGNTIANPGFSGVNLVGTGSASTAFNLTRATIDHNNVSGSGGNGIQVTISNASPTGPGATAGVFNSATDIVSITNNSVTLDTGATQAIAVANGGGNAGSRTQTNFLVQCNGSQTAPCSAPVGGGLGSSSIGTVLLIGNNGFSDMSGTVDKNVITATHTVGGGGGNGIGGGNGVSGAGNAWTPHLKLTVTNNVITGTDGNGILLVGRGTSGVAEFGIRNNNVGAPLSGVRPGIRVDAGNAASADDAVCLDISGNTSAGSGNTAGIGLRKQGTVATTNDFGVEGMAATSSPGVEQFVGNGGGQNPGSANGVADGSVNGVLLISATSGFSNCSTTARLNQASPVHAALESPRPGQSAFAVVESTVAGMVGRSLAWLGSARSHLAATVATATRPHADPVTGVRSTIADLRDRAGALWSPVSRMAHGIASAFSTPLEASPQPPAVDEPLGTVAAGTSVTVIFDVTVNAPPVKQYTNQALVTGSNFTDVLSNSVTTPGDRFNTSTALVSSLNPADQGTSVTFTATVTATEGALTPDGTVQFMDGAANLGTPITCSTAGSLACAAALTTSALTGGPHTITANYLGGTNHDPSTSNTVSQVINVCTVNPVVTTNADSGAGSLRQAIADACGTAGNNVVTFNMGSVVSPITLTSGELAPIRNIVINGPGAKTLTVTRGAAAPAFRIFHVNPGLSFAVSGVSITNGLANGAALDSFGGGLFAEDNTSVTLSAVTVAGNIAGAGGGVFTRAATNSASLTIVNSTINSNLASVDEGGGVLAFGLGGGTATLTMTNTTVSGNTSALTGGGLAVLGTATATTTNSTIAGNVASALGLRAGGVLIDPGTQVILRNTIVAGNTSGTGPITASDIIGAVDASSASNLIGVDSNMTGVTNGANGNQVGTAASPIDPKLGPLGDNGGPTQTRALLQGSPALDAGDNTFVVSPPFTSATPITDQRGTGFARILDSADANTTQTVDIGAYEANVTVEDIADQATPEDTPLSFLFNVGDATTPFDSLTATSSNTTLVPNLPTNIAVTGTGSTRTLSITPALDQSGTSTITVTATRTIAGVAQTASDTFVLTVTAVDDPPTLDPIASPAAIDEDAAQQTVNLTGISAGGGELQPLSVTAASNNTALIPNPTVSYNSPDVTGSLSYTPVANASGSALITVTVSDGANLLQRTFTVTVNPVADTPSITNAATAEDTQTTSGLVITRNPVDGVEVTHFKILSVTGGTLFLADGTTPVAAGAFITAAQGGAGLKFTPTLNSFATGHVTVQASVSALDAGLGGAPVTADITVTAVADAPIFSGASTSEDTATSSGLVLARNAADGAEVTHFRITAIANGTLFQHDGTTPIAVNQVITVAEGNAGLVFLPAPNFFGSASVTAQGATDATGAGAGATTTATITVSAVADTPSVTNASTVVNAQTTSGLVISRNAADGAEVTHFQITNITGGTLFLNDGTTPVAANAFITFAQGNAGLRFTPTTDSVTTGHFTVQASLNNTPAGLGGNTVTADIVVNPLGSTTSVVTSGSPSNPGQSVTFTATVTPSGAGANGTVQFVIDGTPAGSPVALVSGTASFTTTTLASGLHTVSADYSGNPLFTGSTATLAGGQRVRSNVTVVVASSANPSQLDDPITIQATPTAAGGGSATGTVTFKEGASTLATSPLVSGTASFSTSTFPVGTHHLVVDYSGDGLFAAGTATFDQVVTCQVMTLSPATLAPAVTGVPYSQTFTQTGGPGTITFTLTGALPTGLNFNAATATISGIPLAPGSFPIQVTATSSNGCSSATRSYVLATGGGRTVVSGTDAGGPPQVRLFSAADGSTPSGAMTSFLAFDSLFTGGVRVATGDLNGDGVPDVIVGAGDGGSSVRIFNGGDGAMFAEFTPFGGAFRGGVFVAAGDVNGDGRADVIVGSGDGIASEVKVFSGRDGSVLQDFSPFDGFSGGVRVAAGDVNGDGLADIIAGTAPGTATEVKVYNAANLSVMRTLTPYPAFNGGVWVAAGDVTGDGYADVVTGAGPSGGAHVKVFDGKTGAEGLAFFPFAFGGGVRVAVGDVTGDGRADIMASEGPGGTGELRVFDGTSGALISHFDAEPGFAGGMFVATAVPLNRLSIDVPRPDAGTRGDFIVAGWAFEEGSDIADIRADAVPVNGGAAIPLGTATLGDPRPDVAAAFGAQYANAGFHLVVTGLAPGSYDLRVTSHNAKTGVANLTRTARISVHADPQPTLVVDTPRPGLLGSGDFVIAGWALTEENPTPPGVDAVHVWAAPVGGGQWTFLGGATMGGARPDVAAAFGSQFAFTGWSLSVAGLPAGTWDLHVFPRATGAAAFAAPHVVRVIVPGATPVSSRTILTGADAGGTPQVRRFSALDGSTPPTGANAVMAYDSLFSGGVRVAAADLSEDGVPDYFVGAGPGGAPTIRGYDASTGTLAGEIMAFEPTFRGGVFVALGDVDGDGFVDLVVGAGDGRPAEVKVFSGRDGVVEKDLIAFDNFTGGVHVAVGDVNGDGHADIIAGMGFGGAQVKVFNGKDLSVLRTVNAFPNFDGGVWVASGDVNGDGFADLVLGAGQGGGPHVRVLNGRTGADLFGFFAFAPTFTGGVHVAASDVTGDGHADIITGAGPGGSPEVRVFDGVSGNELSAFLAYAPSFTGGVFVAAAPPANKLEIETPVNGESVPGSFPLTGWAFEEGPSSTGVANVQVWAFPVDGTPATFLGVAAMGDARPAVATTYGAQYANSGFHLNVSGLASGTYDVVVYAFSPLTQTFNMQGIVRITVAP